MKRNPYRHGLSYLCEKRVLRPLGDRVLLRAILATDGSAFEILGADTGQAACYEIVATGPKVDEFDYPEGHHCLHISAAGDALDDGGHSNRYTLVPADEIICAWSPEAAQRAFDDMQKEKAPEGALSESPQA